MTAPYQRFLLLLVAASIAAMAVSGAVALTTYGQQRQIVGAQKEERANQIRLRDALIAACLRSNRDRRAENRQRARLREFISATARIRAREQRAESTERSRNLAAREYRRLARGFKDDPVPDCIRAVDYGSPDDIYGSRRRGPGGVEPIAGPRRRR